ncbi:hypothetical protein ACQPZ8_01920 [Actinomadura nitritigenes]|uniref:hypothetical protein n=1 Tax=Actinomadura nitritigenes TaxID=134602 RepID=UPI003D923F68
MTDWVANGISIASLGTTIVFGVLQVRKDGERRFAPPDRTAPEPPSEPPAGPQAPYPTYPQEPTYPQYPTYPQPQQPRPGPVPPPPTPDSVERLPWWMASTRKSFLFSMVITAAITTLLELVSGNPVVQAAIASGLLAAVLAVWLARRSRSRPSYNLTGLLLILVGLAGMLAILALPLAPALRVPQVVVAFTVPWFLLSRLADRAFPNPAREG